MISRLLSRTSYAVVPSNEEDMAASHETKCRKEQDRSYASPLALVICALIIATLSAVGGLGIGLWMKGSKDALPSWTYSLSRVDFGWSKHTFHYNRTFAMAPSEDKSTEAAWDDLVPQGQGFIRYPADSPHTRVVSAVHQLHCLYSIHRTYYLAISDQAAKAKDTKGPHVRHCFDYLRQSLMCAADSSLEPETPDLRGVTGWNFPRRCHNYDELKEWTARWRTNDRTGF